MEVEEALQLTLDALLVVAQCRFVEQVALGGLSAGVSNHTCCSSDECDRFVPASLQMSQHHDATEVSDMETVGSGVDAHVSGSNFLH